jgi:hypothetical protein
MESKIESKIKVTINGVDVTDKVVFENGCIVIPSSLNVEAGDIIRATTGSEPLASLPIYPIEELKIS